MSPAGTFSRPTEELGNDLLKHAAAGLARDHGGRHGGIRAECELLSSAAARSLRADACQLGLQQPRRRRARAGFRRRGPPSRTPGSRRRRQSLPAARRRAGGHAARHREETRRRPRRCPAMPIRSARRRHAYPPTGRLRLRDLAPARLLREFLGERFVQLYEVTRRGEMQDFAARLSPLDFAWYLEPV